jgi:hypothetical protein
MLYFFIERGALLFMRRLWQAEVQERLFVEEVLFHPLTAFSFDLGYTFIMLWRAVYYLVA